MHPTRKSTLVLLVTGVVLFFLSASGPSWLGALGWYGFMVCALLLIVSGLWALVAWIAHRGQPAVR